MADLQGIPDVLIYLIIIITGKCCQMKTWIKLSVCFELGGRAVYIVVLKFKSKQIMGKTQLYEFYCNLNCFLKIWPGIINSDSTNI